MRSSFRPVLAVLLLLVLLGTCAAGGWVWYDNNIDRSQTEHKYDTF